MGGANAVFTRYVPDNSVVAGIPARVILDDSNRCFTQEWEKYFAIISMNRLQYIDIKSFSHSFELADLLTDSRFLITGSTGLIGSTLVYSLLALDKNIQLTCPVRDIKKAETMFLDMSNDIHFIECDIIAYLEGLGLYNDFDYIIHCASPTAGKYMIEHPTETYTLAIDSMRAILEYAKNKENVKGIVYLSSIEYYGRNFDDRIITEDMLGYIDYSDSRSSYPLGKRAAEYLCNMYARQYKVNVMTARLTQTFGPGVSASDNRVFAQFARNVIDGTDIILHTTGESAKPYCYTMDTISAILYILLKGTKGEAYNVANEDTYISIKELADYVSIKFNPLVNVIIEELPDMGYAPVTRLNLSTKKLSALGWVPKYGLETMFMNLIESLQA